MNYMQSKLEQAKRMQQGTRCTLDMPESNLDTSDPQSLLYSGQDEEETITNIADERLQKAMKNVRFAALTKTS